MKNLEDLTQPDRIEDAHGELPNAYNDGETQRFSVFSHEENTRTVDSENRAPRHGGETMANRARLRVCVDYYDDMSPVIKSIIGQMGFKTTVDRYCHARDIRKHEAVQGVDMLLCS